MKITDLARKNVLQMKAYSSARDEFTDTDQDFIFQDANENPFQSGYNRYPDPNATKVKEKLSDLKGIPPANMILGNGSDEVLDLLFRAFCEPKIDEIITTPPTYGMYKVLAEVNEIQLNEVPLTPDFQLKPEAVLEAVSDKTKLIFLCSPNNPSGNLMNTQAVKQILKNFSGLVILDEAYIDFAAQNSFVSELNHFPNLVVLQTFSKAYAHAGIRLGMGFAQAEIIQLLNKIKPPYNVNQLTQEKALEVIASAETYKNQVEMLISERDLLCKELEKISFVEKIYPSEANFLLVKVDNAILRYHQLIEKGMVVRNRTNEMHCEDCLRISIGTPKENQKLIIALQELNA
ncbi:histidinol-phosphate transaminase [Psychroflexus planctonicus]|uniref:Histidinol-phosphate aminotransferase n=1 Tax=Psychroflexus planctonicus TaxID=1526575 RepID=A0ABQ1SCK9_9FLAO|nr:histidinol-phosphate transaminase [Psychroflexus planctonicus]GGE26766.1 histidinol-phosphate aminotransferase [Psychroflexus planctonicus]